MNIKEYEDKVRGCWLGKNVGGTLGAPLEGHRGVFDITYYTHDITEGPLPNDDLDLQLVWLNAAEKYGRNVNSEILGEYWLSYVVADWSEYGAGKNNLAMGLLPPLSGRYNNHNKDSCGCFIRSELWACLAPGHPDIAVEYAYEDAIVDHADEGVYAEIFCAAVESAAFVESDTRKLINIGLSYIPEDCAIALAVNTAVECYDGGKDWKAARKKILQTVPGSFGMFFGYEDREPEPDVPVGELGYDAPSNIGIMIIGWLYGEGDFSKSLCIAANCGEDADCTAATLGAIFGIIMGAKNIPEKWLSPLGDNIKIGSVDNTSSAVWIPDTISNLTERVCNLMPVFLLYYSDILSEDGPSIRMSSGEQLMAQSRKVGVYDSITFREKLEERKYGVKRQSMAFDVIVKYMDGIHVKPEEEKKISLTIINKIHRQQWVTAKWHLPEEWSVSPCEETAICLDQEHGGTAVNHAEFIITPHAIKHGKNELILELKSNGRVSTMFIPITLFA